MDKPKFIGMVIAWIVIAILFYYFNSQSYENFFLAPTNSLNHTSIYLNFFNQYFSTKTPIINLSHFSNQQCINAMLRNSTKNPSGTYNLNKIDIQSLNSTCIQVANQMKNIQTKTQYINNYLEIKDIALPLLNSYYQTFLQISLTVASILFGLYALIFIEIIKALDEREIKWQEKEIIRKYAKHIKRALILIFAFFSVIPFILLVGTIGNLYTTYKIYQNIERSAYEYLTFSNLSSTSNSYFSYYNFTYAVFNETTNNVTKNITLQDAGNVIFTSIFDLPNFILNNIVYSQLASAINYVGLNLFLYGVLFIITIKPASELISSKEKGQQTKLKL